MHPLVHSISNLRYQLLAGEVSLAGHRILDSRRIEWREWQVTLYALAASHAVSLVRPGDGVFEILSCAPDNACGGTILLSASCSRWRLTTEVGGLEYACSLAPVRLGDADGRIAAHDGEIEVRYPEPHGLQTPLTRLTWRGDAEGLHIATLHTYPEERRAVATESAFRVIRSS